MAHLSPDAFVDLLDGTVAESAVPHLVSCASCRRQLAELRVTWQAAIDADSPEPSPLFWNHLSARVHAAVAAEPLRNVPWWRVAWSWRVAGLAGAAAAAVAVVVAIQVPHRAPLDLSPAMESASIATGAPAEIQPMAPLPEDESFGFVADLVSDLDWDAVSELGLASRGGADRAVAEMNDGERVELQRLLNEALAGGV